MWAQYLRSPAVCTTFSGFMTLLSYVTASSSGTCTTAGAGAAMVCVTILAFDILHCGIVISIRVILVCRQVRNSLLDVNILALQQGVHNLTELEVSCTEPSRVP
jgi:hypothetical protein